jgi:hypothetical protein
MNRRSFLKTLSALIPSLFMWKLLPKNIIIGFLDDQSFLYRDLETVKRTNPHKKDSILRIWEIKEYNGHYGYVQFKPTDGHHWGVDPFKTPSPYYPIPMSEFNKLKLLGISIKNGSDIPSSNDWN